MPRERVTLTGRQLAALGLEICLIAGQLGVVWAGGPLWLQAVLAGLISLALILCVFVVLIPLVRKRW